MPPGRDRFRVTGLWRTAAVVHKIRLGSLALVLVAAGCSSAPSASVATTAPRPTDPPVATIPSDPIAQAEIAFSGNPRQSEIRAALDAAFAIYGLEPTDENYSRAGSALVALRQAAEGDNHPEVTEMAILVAMTAGGGYTGLSFPEAAAFAATAIRR